MHTSWSDLRIYTEQLVTKVYQQVLPLIAAGGDELVTDEAGTDIVAKIDQVAGRLVEQELRDNCPEPCALLDEAHGQLRPLRENPTIGFIVDEFDGTRPARMKMPTNAICAAVLPLDTEPLLRHVRIGAIHLMTGELFSFERGKGIWRNGQQWQTHAGASELTKLRYHYETAGGHPVLANWYLLPFVSSQRYGVSVLASSAYSCSRLLVGGIDFYLHLSKRLERTWPELTAVMRNWHQGATGQYAWDLATTVPLMWEAGFLATRTDGTTLANVRVDDGSAANVHDLLVSRTEAIHQLVQCRLAQQETKLRRHKDELLKLLLLQ